MRGHQASHEGPVLIHFLRGRRWLRCGPARGSLFPVTCGGWRFWRCSPGSGKSVLARGVAEAIRATYLRIDTIESTIVSTLMPYRDNPVGYVVAERVAADQPTDGRDVVADAVNGVAAARAGWVALAARTGAAVQFVEVLTP
jgi:hypothetical protein